MIDSQKLYAQIGSKLSAARKSRKISQGLISEKLNLTRISISNIERGVQKAPLQLIYEYCEILNLELTDVFPTINEVIITEDSIAKNVKNLDLDTDLPRGVANLIRSINKNN